MPACKFCGTWSGFSTSEHANCATASAEGKTNDEIRADLNLPPLIAPGPLTSGSIFWSVFGALWAFGITAGIVVAILRALLT